MVNYYVNCKTSRGKETTIPFLGKACFHDLALSSFYSQVVDVRMNIKDYCKSENKDCSLTREIVSNIYRILPSVFVNTFDDFCETGNFIVSGDYDGRIVVNALSYYRQFSERKSGRIQYSKWREMGASFEEALVLSMCFRKGWCFITRRERNNIHADDGHTVTPYCVHLPSRFESFAKGMDLSENKGNLAQHKGYAGRHAMFLNEAVEKERFDEKAFLSSDDPLQFWREERAKVHVRN